MQKYNELPKSKTALIADKSIIYILFSTGCENLISDLYEQVLISPKMYSYFVHELDADSLKVLKNSIKKSDFDVDESDTQDVKTQFSDMSDDEAFGLIMGETTKVDVILDDPNIANVFKLHGINTLRLSDVISAAIVSDNENLKEKSE